MTLLVVASPCALVIATPATILSAIASAARNGVLFKGGRFIEALGRVRAVAFDKTGTLTRGRFEVTDVVTIEGAREDELLAWAAGAEKRSQHPLAQAVVRAAETRGIAVPTATAVDALPGRGIVGRADGRPVMIGNVALMRERGVDLGWAAGEAARLAAGARTVMLVAVSHDASASADPSASAPKVIGLLGLADTPRAESARAIAGLKAMGLEVVMITGDNQATADAIARLVAPSGEIDRVVAGVLPDRKAAEVKALQAGGRVVAMVGDGINDAPALAQADVGIAIGSGTDVAIEAADITLMRSDLTGVADAIRLSRRTLRVIKQNLFWAFVYNVVGIPIAAGALYPLTGWLLNPMIAAAAMSFSSVSVLANSLRLRRA
jgi:Cu+-exporting ATPase